MKDFETQQSEPAPPVSEKENVEIKVEKEVIMGLTEAEQNDVPLQEQPKPQWPGNNRFCCNMRIMYGPSTDNMPLLSGWVSLIAASIIYWGCVCPYLWMHVSPIIPSIGTFLLLLDMWVYARACFVDPGVIPRMRLQQDIIKRYPGSLERRMELLKIAKTKGDIYQETEPSGMTLPECGTCRVERPPLSSHCRFCDNCVEGWDHHCNWIGNCVGQRNHRAFVIFITLTCLCCLYLIMSAIWFLVHKWTLIGNISEVGAFILIVSLFVLFGFLFPNVTILHLELVMSGQTIKMRDRNGRKLVGLKKAFRNLWAFCLFYSPRPSLVDTGEVRWIPE